MTRLRFASLSIGCLLALCVASTSRADDDPPVEDSPTEPAPDEPPPSAEPSLDSAEPLDLATWKMIADSIDAFAVQLDDGDAVTWQRDDKAREALGAGLDTEAAETDVELSAGEPITIYVLAKGTLYRFAAVGVEPGAPGAALLGNTVVPGKKSFLRALGEAIDLEVAKASRRATRRQAVADGKMTIEFPEPSDADDKPQYNVIVYADNPGSTMQRDWVAAYVAARASTTTIVAAQATDPQGTIDALAVRPEGSCVKHLGIVVHGSPDGFIVGSSAIGNWVGASAGMFSPDDFGKGLRPHLCADARIQVTSCRLAGTAGGKKILQRFAAATGATIEASAQLVWSRPSATPIPRMWTTGDTVRSNAGKAPTKIASGTHDRYPIP